MIHLDGMLELDGQDPRPLNYEFAQEEITLGRETRLLQVLALAGGFADFANTKRILIIREDDSGGQKRIEVNYEKIISGENMEMNLKLKPGDTIVVP